MLAGEYRIAGTLRQDGFCISYDAEDVQLKRHVLIKEFFPAEIADRFRLVTVRPKSTRQVGVLSWGRQRFIEEAQTLSKFSHPGIARIKRVFEENNTAYAVVDAEDWPTLLSWVDKLRRQPTQVELDAAAKQLLDALEVLHDANVLARDLSPESIYIRDQRQMVLVDFGTAKAQFAARARKMHAVVRPGYSAPEQYLFDHDQQGPWTDIFSLGAVLYRLYTGRSPVDVIHRHDVDDMAKVAATPTNGYRIEFLRAIDLAMSLSPADRPQNIKAFRPMLLEAGKTQSRGVEAKPTDARPVAPTAAMPQPIDAIQTSNAPQPASPPKPAGPATQITTSEPASAPPTARAIPTAENAPPPSTADAPSAPLTVPAPGGSSTAASQATAPTTAAEVPATPAQAAAQRPAPRIPAGAVPSALLSDKPAEEDRLGFTLDNLPEPEPEPDRKAATPAAKSDNAPSQNAAPVKSDPSRTAEMEAMAVSNRRFMMAVIGIMVGLIGIIGLGLVTLERTLRQDRPASTQDVAERARLEATEKARAEAKRLAEDTERQRKEDETRRNAEAKQAAADAERRKREDETRRAADEKRLAAEAEAARQTEATRQAEAKRIAEAKQASTESERRKREEDAARAAEERRIAADAERRRQEDARISADQKRQADEADRKRREDDARRVAEEKRMAEEAERRRLEEAKRTTELKRLAEEAERRRVDETRRATEERRLTDEAERRRQEAQRRNDDQRRLAEETERKRQEELRRIAEARQQAELKQQAEETVRRTEQQRLQAEQRVLGQIAAENSREVLLRIAAQDTARRGVVEKRLIELGYIKITTGEGDVWRKPGSGEAFRDCPTCPTLAAVPGGQFLMGSPAGEAGRQDDEDDTPGPGGAQVSVTLPSPFAVGRYEVTRGQFAAFVTETGYSAPGPCYVRVDAFDPFPDLNWRSPGFPQDDEHPVACISWLDARAYVAWLSRKTGYTYRLMTEAEWEFAARGAPKPVLQPRYPFGAADKDLCAFANAADQSAQRTYPGWQVARCNDGYDHTAPVGSFEPNAIGLHDMLGNLWEWTGDCYTDSLKGRGQPAQRPAGPQPETCNQALRILRGGSWSDPPDSLRSASRIAIPADKRIQIGGFRVLRSLDP